ncbi:MAG: hypothetical protein A2341_21355 [Deltaproteobacteria bacterium RIFOXYB12_FULL_58_9]|nr:MAG: hypothetical protein A2341_21355 [Deltaproteobacteria bacterium RIFOXYB12_FULL_58_9]
MSLDLESAIRSVSQDSLLSLMPQEALSKLRETFSVRAFVTGEKVCVQGCPADRLVIPVDGSFSLMLHTPVGRVENIGSLAPPRSLNLKSVLAQDNWEYTAEADADMSVLEASASDFLRVLAEAAPFHSYLRLVTSFPQARKASRTLRSLGTKPAGLWELINGLHERTVKAFETLAGDHEKPQWVLPLTCELRLSVKRQDEVTVLTELVEGEYYGATTILGAELPFSIEVKKAGGLLYAEAEHLRRVCSEHPDLRLALMKEHPSVMARLRPGLLTFGEQLTNIVSLNAQPVAELATETQADGTPQKDDTGPGRPFDTGSVGSWRAVTSHRWQGVRCKTDVDTAAAATASLCAFFGKKVSFPSLRRQLRKHVACSFLDIAQAAEHEGLICHAVACSSVEVLGRLDVPFIAMAFGRFVVVYRITRDEVAMFDPCFGLRSVEPEKFISNASRHVLVVRVEDTFFQGISGRTKSTSKNEAKNAPSESASLWNVGLRFIRLFTQSRKLLMHVGIFSGCLMLLGTLSPRLTQMAVDRALGQQDVNFLRVLAIGMIFVSVSTLAFRWAKTYLLAHIARSFDYRVSTLFYQHALSLACDTQEKNRVGTMLSRMSELERVRQFFGSGSLGALLDLFSGVFFSIFIFTYDVSVGFVAVLAAIVCFVVVRLAGFRFHALGFQAFDKQSEMQSRLSEQVEAIASIKAIGAESAARARWESLFVDSIGIQRSLLHTHIAMNTSLRVVQEAARVGILYFAITAVFADNMTAGAVLAVSQYASLALVPFIGFGMHLNELQRVMVSLQKIVEVASKQSEDPVGTPTTDLEFGGALSLRNVSFSYGEDGPPVLDNISFSVKPGHVVAIVGASGCGKTTLAKLVVGLLKPTSGEVVFDDVDASSLSRSAIRRNVGYVLQDSQLFAGTILENIAYCDDRPNPERVRDAARLAAAHEFIRDLPGGYSTYLAEGGMGLSGGQKQRLNIARALYRDPKIVILDEATSSLDAESERAILANTRVILKGRTALVIAHRLNTVRNADSILVMSKGAIAEMGTHSELMAKEGIYFHLFSQQLLLE